MSLYTTMGNIRRYDAWPRQLVYKVMTFTVPLLFNFVSDYTDITPPAQLHCLANPHESPDRAKPRPARGLARR